MLNGQHYPLLEIDMVSLVFILGSLLVIGGLRTFEMLKGITEYAALKAVVGACLLDPQIQHQTRLVGGMETNINAISHFVEE